MATVILGANGVGAWLGVATVVLLRATLVLDGYCLVLRIVGCAWRERSDGWTEDFAVEREVSERW